MYRKAQNFAEIAILACVVVVIALSVGAIYNNQKTRLADLSKVTVTNGSQQGDATVNPNMTADQKNSKISNSNAGVETAGALSLLGMTSEQFNFAMSNLTYAQLEKALKDSQNNNEKDLFELAGDLGANVDATNVTADTLKTLTNLLNTIPSSGQTEAQQQYVQRFQSLLSSVGTGS